MRGLHSAVLVRSKLRNYCSIGGAARLKAGTCGLMGNKGATSMEVRLLGMRFQLVNCHLAPHQSDSPTRNETIARIMQ
jgi:hypothetical protein